MNKKLLDEIKKDYKQTFGTKPSDEIEFGMRHAVNYIEDKKEMAKALKYVSTGPKIVRYDIEEKKVSLLPK